MSNGRRAMSHGRGTCPPACRCRAMGVDHACTSLVTRSMEPGRGVSSPMGRLRCAEPRFPRLSARLGIRISLVIGHRGARGEKHRNQLARTVCIIDVHGDAHFPQPIGGQWQHRVRHIRDDLTRDALLAKKISDLRRLDVVMTPVHHEGGARAHERSLGKATRPPPFPAKRVPTILGGPMAYRVNLAASEATWRPWNFAAASSLAVGVRLPSPPAIVEAP